MFTRMAKLSTPKKSGQILVRLTDEQNAQFEAALLKSDLTAQEAIRRAIQAMVIAAYKFGRIPSDMEIRQAAIGDMNDINALAARMLAVAEEQAAYNAARSLPISRPETQQTPKKQSR